MTAPAHARIRLTPIRDPAALEAEWRALEAIADASFFQSWTWVGCLAAERFPDPWLLRAEGADGTTLGLALLNRRGGRLWLNESGDPALDAAYVEHNGVLLARTATGLLADCLGALLGGSRRPLVLSGVAPAMADAVRAAGGIVRVRRENLAPFADLAAAGGTAAGYLATLSANTRQQLRRSDRSFAPVTVRAAGTVAEAWAFLDALAALHQATWTARGRPGAFAEPQFRRFHRALLARAVPRGEAMLLHVQGAAGTIGYLYNFRWRGRMLAYQSGFDYAASGRHGKPGLTCHHAAIGAALAAGDAVYDFLAGADRYKTSLGGGMARMVWLEAAAARSLAGLRLHLGGAAARLRRFIPGLVY